MYGCVSVFFCISLRYDTVGLCEDSNFICRECEKLALRNGSHVRAQCTSNVDVLCVDPPRAKDQVRFLIAGEVLVAGCVPVFLRQSSCRDVAVCADSRYSRSAVQVAGRGSCRVAGLP